MYCRANASGGETCEPDAVAKALRALSLQHPTDDADERDFLSTCKSAVWALTVLSSHEIAEANEVESLRRDNPTDDEKREILRFGERGVRHYWGCRVPRNLSMQCRLLIQIYTEGLSRFVTSTTAPVASGWSGWSGGLAPTWKAPPCHGAHVKRSFLIATVAVIVGGIGRSQEDVGLIEVSGLVRNAGPWLSDRWSRAKTIDIYSLYVSLPFRLSRDALVKTQPSLVKT